MPLFGHHHHVEVLTADAVNHAHRDLKTQE